MKRTVVQTNSDSRSEHKVSNEEYNTCCCDEEYYTLPRLGDEAPMSYWL